MKGRVFWSAGLLVALVALAVLFWQTSVPVPPPAERPVAARPVVRPTQASTPTTDPDLSIVFVPPVVVAAASTVMAATPQAPVALSAPAPKPVKSELAIEDGKTIDFSPGVAVVKDEADEKAALAKALKEMDEATKNVRFGPRPAP